MALLRFLTALALTTSVHSFAQPVDDAIVITETLTRYVFTCPCDLATSVSFGTVVPTSPVNVINNDGWVDWSGNNTASSVATTVQSSQTYATPSSTISFSTPSPPGSTPTSALSLSTTSASTSYGAPGSPGSSGSPSITTQGGASTPPGVIGGGGFPSDTPSSPGSSSSLTTTTLSVIGGEDSPNNPPSNPSSNTSGPLAGVTSSTTQTGDIITTSSTTTSIDAVGSQTTSAAATSSTTTSVAPGTIQPGTSFVCIANVNGRKLRARDILYFTIEDGQGVMVADSTEAVPLVLTSNGGLAEYSDGVLLGAPEFGGVQPFELVDDVSNPVLTSDWSIGENGLQHSDVSFCLLSDSTVDVTFGDTVCEGTVISLVPTTDCVDCNLPNSGSTATTTTVSFEVVATSSSSTTSADTTTTSAATGPDNPGQDQPQSGTSTSTTSETTTSAGIGYGGSSSTTTTDATTTTSSASESTSTSTSSAVDVAVTSSTTTSVNNEEGGPTSTTSSSTTDETSTTSLTSSMTTMTMTLTTSGSLTTTTTADTSMPTAGQPFSIQVEVPGGLKKRDILVVGYVNGQLVLVSSPANAVAFVLTPDGVLMIFNTGLVVGFGGGSGTSALVIYSSVSAMPTTLIWSVSGGALVLPGAGFCVGAGNVMSVNVGTATDSSCTPVTPVPNTDASSYNTAAASTITPSPQTSTTSTTGSSTTSVSLTSTTTTTTSSTSAITTTSSTSTTSASPSPSGLCDPTNNNGCTSSCPYCVQPVGGTTSDSSCGSTAYCSNCNVDADCSIWGDGFTCGSYLTCTTASGYSGNACVQSDASICPASPLLGTTTSTITSTTVYISTSTSTSTSATTTSTSSTTITTTSSNLVTSTTTTASRTFATDGPNCSIAPLPDQTAPNGALYTQFFYGCAASIPTTVGSSYTELIMNRPAEDPTRFLERCVQTAEQLGATVWTFSQSVTDLNWSCGLWSGLSADTSYINADTSVFTMNAMVLVDPSNLPSSTTTSIVATTTTASSGCQNTILSSEEDTWQILYDTVRLGGAVYLLGSDVSLVDCIELCYGKGDCNGVELGPDDSGIDYCWGFASDDDYTPIDYATWDTALKISGDMARVPINCDIPSDATTTTTSTTTDTTTTSTSSTSTTSSAISTTTSETSTTTSYVSTTSSITTTTTSDTTTVSSITSTPTSITSTTTAPSTTTTDAGVTATCTEEWTYCISTIAGVVIGATTCDSTISGDCITKASQLAASDGALSYVITDDQIYTMNVDISVIEGYLNTCGQYDPLYDGIFYNVNCQASSSTTSTISTTSETSTTQTTTTSTTTSDTSEPTSTFYVVANPYGYNKKNKRTIEYVSFDTLSGLSIIVESEDDAAIFTIASDGSLILAGPSPIWIGVSVTEPQQLVLTTSQPEPPVTATIFNGNILNIAGLTQECILGSAFVVTTGDTVPTDCQLVSLQILSVSSVSPTTSTTTSIETSTTLVTTSVTTTTSPLPTSTCTNGEVVFDDYAGYDWEILCGQGSYYGWDHFSAYADVTSLGDCIVRCDDDPNCNAVSIEYRDAPDYNLCGFIYTTTDFQPYPFDADTAIRISGPNAIPSISVTNPTSTTTTSVIATTTTISAPDSYCTAPSAIGKTTALYSTSITFNNFYTSCGESFEGATSGGLGNLQKQFAVNWQAPDYSGYDFHSAVQRCIQFAADNEALVVEFYTDVNNDWFCVGLADVGASDSLFYPDTNVNNVWGFVWDNPCNNSPLGALTSTDGTYFSNFYTSCSTSLQGNTPGGLVNLNREVSVNWLPGNGDYYGWTFEAALAECADSTVQSGANMFEFYTTADGTWYCIAVNDLPAKSSSFYYDNTVDKVWGFTIAPTPSNCVPSQLAGEVITTDGFIFSEFYDGCQTSMQGNTPGGLGNLQKVFAVDFPPYDDLSYGGWTLDTAVRRCMEFAVTEGASTVEFYESSDSPPTWYCVGVNNGLASSSMFYTDTSVNRVWAFVQTAAVARV